MPLEIARVGQSVRFIAVDAGHGLRARLAAMGLIPGVEIEVLRNSIKGPLLIGVEGSRIVLGRGMARKIIVA